MKTPKNLNNATMNDLITKGEELTNEELLKEIAIEIQRNAFGTVFRLCLHLLEKKLFGYQFKTHEDAVKELKNTYPEYFL